LQGMGLPAVAPKTAPRRDPGRNRIGGDIASHDRSPPGPGPEEAADQGRSGTKPTLLEAQILMRTWADWEEAEPGFDEIDGVGHEGGTPLPIPTMARTTMT